MGMRNTWVSLIAQYLVGQGLINLINILVGLIILRVLSVEEFALYTSAMVLQQAAGIGSDMGLSQAINTMGAKMREDQYLLNSLYAGARFYGYRFYAVSAGFVIVLFILIQSNHGWSWVNLVSVLFFILLTSALQVTVNFRKAVLNVNHDAKSLFYAGITQAGVRVIFVPLCLIWPYALVALLGNLVGTYACKCVIELQCTQRFNRKQMVMGNLKKDLRNFIIPLMPVMAYHTLQGQISVFLLAYYGYTTSIAEVGALGRLGQLIGLLMLLNNFFVMPVFSRISQKKEFIKKGRVVIFLLIIITLISMLTVYLLPGWWLYILGQNYTNLRSELPIAVFAAFASLIGATLYVLVISRNTTNGQFWYIIFGLSAQVVFLAKHGINSTYDALWLNLIPTLSYVCVQAAILATILIKWKDKKILPTTLENSASDSRCAKNHA